MSISKQICEPIAPYRYIMRRSSTLYDPDSKLSCDIIALAYYLGRKCQIPLSSVCLTNVPLETYPSNIQGLSSL